MRLRPQPRAPIEGRQFDVAIIGGGINGVAIARECARGGRRTLLIEQNDFASGTTSRSTRIIHGGLRYLEHGEIGLVRESLRERQRLLRERPHLVRPLSFVLALPPGRRSTIEIRLGLWLYRKFAGNGSVRSTDSERLLDRDCGDLRLFTYDDAQCEFPERLVAEWLADALESGATVRNHTQVIAIEVRDGHVRGLRLRDSLRGTEYRVEASRVINATGPWADAVCRSSGIETQAPMIGGVRGSHIVLTRFPGAPNTAMYTEAPDGRPVFVIPWNGQILVGTTEVRDNGDPAKARPSESEIAYLISAVQRLVPGAKHAELTHAFAGVRPLPHAPGRDAASITRRHFLHDHAEDGAEGLTSIIGGKLTTAASLARQCARQIGIEVPEPRSVETVDGDKLTGGLERFTRDIALIAGITPEAAGGLVSRHGLRALTIAQLMAADDRLRQPLADGNDFRLGEAAYAIRREAAVTLSDLLLRRVPIALGADASDNMAMQAARRVGELLGWNEATIRAELESFEEERSAFLVRPAVRLAA